MLNMTTKILLSDAWYRCEVVEVMSPKVRVNFFDYGNEAVVELSELTPLPHTLCETYPLGTFRCSLHGKLKTEERMSTCAHFSR